MTHTQRVDRDVPASARQGEAILCPEQRQGIVKLLEVLVASVHNPLVLPVGHHYLVPAPKDRLHREAA